MQGCYNTMQPPETKIPHVPQEACGVLGVWTTRQCLATAISGSQQYAHRACTLTLCNKHGCDKNRDVTFPPSGRMQRCISNAPVPASPFQSLFLPQPLPRPPFRVKKIHQMSEPTEACKVRQILSLIWTSQSKLTPWGKKVIFL